MRLVFIADGRSPTALNWIKFFVNNDNQVHLVSTFPCKPDLSLESLTILPVAFSYVAGDYEGSPDWKGALRKIIPVSMRTALRQRLGPYSLPQTARKLHSILADVSPDLVHAMRVPYEGMLAALADYRAPLLVSVWGNDFTLHASSTARMRRLTEHTMLRTDALHTDCQRDLRLSKAWGFPSSRPHIVLPGAGGIQLDTFLPSTQNIVDSVDPEGGTVINPRGFRAYIRNDTFFQSIPMVLAKRSETRFICPAMAAEAEAKYWVEKLRIDSRVTLLPRQEHSKMAALYQSSHVAVSPSTHDGTPNTLLEAMASGCLPIAGDIESLREWITPGINGLLIDPDDPDSLAEAILLALSQNKFRERAKEFNINLVTERAEYYEVMRKAENFYKLVIERTN